LLPYEVLTRPKTPAGMISQAYLRQPGTEWVDQWTPMPELEKYIRRDAIPPIYGDPEFESSAIDSRPVIFNEWVRTLRQTIKK